MLYDAKVSNVLNFLFKLLSTISAMTPAFFVFFITNYTKYCSDEINLFIKDNKLIFFAGYIGVTLIIVLVLNCIFLKIASNLEGDGISGIISIEPVNDNFLPTYLGYFFVSVSITSLWVFSYFIILVISFNLFSKIYFFNPTLLLSGYKFYHLVSTQGVKVILITKKDLRAVGDLSDGSYKRINDFTFIQVKK